MQIDIPRKKGFSWPPVCTCTRQRFDSFWFPSPDLLWITRQFPGISVLPPAFREPRTSIKKAPCMAAGRQTSVFSDGYCPLPPAGQISFCIFWFCLHPKSLRCPLSISPTERVAAPVSALRWPGVGLSCLSCLFFSFLLLY